MSYLNTVNMRTAKNLRQKHSYVDFECNEYWDIYCSISLDTYTYMSKEEAISDNNYNYTNHVKGRLLNWPEWNFTEIMDRYKDLKNSNFETIYNLLFYEFSGAEILRGEKVKKHILKAHNVNIQLENNQTELISLLKNCSVLAYQIISEYKNVFDNYTEGDQELYSFLNCDFIKNDLSYLLTEAGNSLIGKFRKIYNNHFYLLLSVIILEMDIIIYYSLSAYDLYEIKEIKEEDNIIERIRREINWSREIQLEQDAMSADGNRKRNLDDNKTHNTFVFRGFEDQKSIRNILRLKKNSNATNNFFKNIFGYKQTQQNKQPTLEIVIQKKNGENILINKLEGEVDQSKEYIIHKERNEDLLPTNKLCIDNLNK